MGISSVFDSALGKTGKFWKTQVLYLRVVDEN